ncbi:hypothetical protein [Nocardia sp. NBC_00511]|uniref:hypothetical protein n=1 Tax=Nocardia sp. NBC_00511 TaxID=2903591 RepID=UPI0030E0B849
MEVDSAWLPTRLEFSQNWQNQVSANKVGTEIMNAYTAAINRRSERMFALTGGKTPPRHEGIISARQRLMMLIETDTWEQYTQVQNATLGLGNYRASGPTEVNDEPVMYIAGTRFMIQSVQVWTGWEGCTDPVRLESEVLGCIDKIRGLRPRPAVRGDYSSYSDDELSRWDDQHRSRLIERREL